MKYDDFDFKKLYIELFLDLNVNISCFCLSEEQKQELKDHIERYWREHCKDMMLADAHDYVFKMRLREMLEDED